MRDAPYLNRHEANAARSRRAQEARQRTKAETHPLHQAHGFDFDKDGRFATSVDCDCSIGHDHEEQR